MRGGARECMAAGVQDAFLFARRKPERGNFRRGGGFVLWIYVLRLQVE